jgi:S-formylglutathione hydrolase FrmB
MALSRVVVERFDSEILKGNPLGDPSERDVSIYLPPGYDRNSLPRYPVIYSLVGFGGTGRMLFNVDPLMENLQTRVDRLIATRRCGPIIIAAVNCFTKFGGSQYLNSSAVGQYEDYVTKDVVGFVESRYRCGRRGVWGKSSGGFGAMVLGLKHPEVFSALADHSGDAGFEYCYPQDFPRALKAFRDAGSPSAWLDGFWKKPNRKQLEDFQVLNVLAMAAHYSPNPNSPHMGIDFPFDLETGEWRNDIWARWKEWDPVQLVERYADNLRKHRLIYIDCGTNDEFNLQWGAPVLHSKLMKWGINHYYEEFDDGHMNITYRYDVSLPKLYEALKE